MFTLGQKACPTCGDTHLCPGALSVSATPPGLIAKFVEDIVIPAPAGRTNLSAMYEFYKQWCLWRGEAPIPGLRRFNRALESFGMVKERIGGWYWWLGVEINVATYNEAMQQAVRAS